MLVHNRPHFYMFVGLPGSGKSTFRKDILHKHSGDERSTCILSTDDYVENLARQTGRTYQQVFKQGTEQSHTVMYQSLGNAIKQRSNIVWDQTNLTKKVRRKKLSQIPKEYYKVAVYFDTNFDEVDRVNEERQKSGRAIPQSVIDDMIMSRDVPDISEGFDKIILVVR